MNDDYNDLTQTGYLTNTEITPEDDFFHSIYISGVMRENHIGIVEKVGKLQIRGVQYNLDEVYFIITHVKQVLVKREKVNKRDKVMCFSYQNTKPWKGSNGNICPMTRYERDNDQSCKGCKSEIIVSGILSDEDGAPVINDGKPIFVFIRGKGIKSFNIYDYLKQISEIDIEPIFPDNPTLEKMVVKNKRHVTKVTVSTMESEHGLKSVFGLDVGKRLKNLSVMEILKIQKKTLQQFNEKFDWSNNMKSGGSQISGYVEESNSGSLTNDSNSDKKSVSEDVTGSSDFSFDGIDF